MDKVIIETKLTLADFTKVNYILLFQKISTKILLLVVLLMIVLPVFLAIRGMSYNWLQSVIGIVLAAFYLFSARLGAKRNFESTPAISGLLRYEFTNDRLACTGEAAFSQTTWNKVYRVSETKECILIWKSSQLVNVLPKRDISVSQRVAIKKMLLLNKVKNSLK
ncbi:MAG: YcxB family protein [Bacteroidota bacterium]